MRREMNEHPYVAVKLYYPLYGYPVGLEVLYGTKRKKVLGDVSDGLVGI
jgi:hypothetical protein